MSWYRAALSAAKRRDVSAAYRYARAALLLEPESEKAPALLELCLREKTGGAWNAAPVRKAAAARRYREALRLAAALPDCGQRDKIFGCLCALRGQWRRAGGHFARALERDTGDEAARLYLAEAAKRQSRFGGIFG